MLLVGPFLFKAALLTFNFTSAGVLGLTSFRKATDPEDTRDSTDTEVIIWMTGWFSRRGTVVPKKL